MTIDVHNVFLQMTYSSCLGETNCAQRNHENAKKKRGSQKPTTSRERPKSATYLRLKNIQKTIGETSIFFSKKYLEKKSHIAEKPKKRPFRFIKRFLQTENFEKFKGTL